MKEFILIRHGQTDYNNEMRFMGFTDAPLNSKGIDEAKSVTSNLKDEDFNSIISSPLKRCFDTAATAFPEQEVITENAFKEMNFGIFEGMTYGEIEEKYPDELSAWNSDKLNYVIPEGESIQQTSERVIEKFQELLENYNGKTVIITHSGTIRIILAHYIMNSLYETWRFSVEHCKTTRLNFCDEYAYLKTLNQ